MNNKNNYETATEYLHSNIIDGYTISLNDKVYYARIIPKLGIYDIYDLIIRAITPSWFSTYDDDKNSNYSFLFNNSDIGKIVFTERDKALEKVRYAEENNTIVVSNEIEYEEY